MPADDDGLTGPLDRFSLLLLAGVGLLFLCKAPLAIGAAFEADEFDLFRQGLEFLADPASRLTRPHKLLGAMLFAIGAATGQSDPVVGLIVNRIVAVVLCLLTYLLTMRIAGRLYGSRAAVHALVGLGSVFVYIDHSFTARTDLVYLTLFLLSLDLVLRRTPIATALAGGVMGLALGVSLKASLLAASLFCALTVASIARRHWADLLRRVGAFAAGLGGVVLLYIAVRALFVDEAPTVVQATAPTVAIVMGSDTGTDFSSFWLAMARQNAVFLAVSLAALTAAAVRCWRLRGRGDDEIVVVAVVAAYLAAALIYPHNWPYHLATLAPGLALFWGAACGEVHRQLQQDGSRPLQLVAIAILAAVGFAQPADRVRLNLALDNDYQIAVIDRIHQVLGPQDTYFDGTGMALTLPRSDDIWLDVINQTAIKQNPDAVLPLIDKLAGASIGAIVLNERIEALPARFHQFRETYFVQDWGSVFVPGADLQTHAMVDRELPLPILTAGTYHVRGDAGAWRHIRIDGQPLGGQIIRLEAGDHRVTADANVGRVRLLRLPAQFEETREPLDSYKSLFPKERFILGH